MKGQIRLDADCLIPLGELGGGKELQPKPRNRLFSRVEERLWRESEEPGGQGSCVLGVYFFALVTSDTVDPPNAEAPPARPKPQSPQFLEGQEQSWLVVDDPPKKEEMKGQLLALAVMHGAIQRGTTGLKRRFDDIGSWDVTQVSVP
jgi:hypothetical protein